MSNPLSEIQTALREMREQVLCANCGEPRSSHHMGGQEHQFEPVVADSSLYLPALDALELAVKALVPYTQHNHCVNAPVPELLAKTTLAQIAQLLRK